MQHTVESLITSNKEANVQSICNIMYVHYTFIQKIILFGNLQL